MLTLLSASAGVLLLFAASESLADRNVNANEPVVISDDITDETTDVTSASGPPLSGDDGDNDNRSGLGDGTNPGQGDGSGNSPNDGTDNPNNNPNGGGSGGGPPH
jgi:hypothetical protein